MIETTLNANLSLITLDRKVDQLSKDMVEGFDMVYERIDEKIDGLRNELTLKMDRRFAVVDKRFDRIDTDMDLIKKSLVTVLGQLTVVSDRLSGVTERLVAIENKIGIAPVATQ